ncbi:hypothetical protein JTE90_019593 [Oedothorax gibbosus]|uniref:Uncharacterized protein n=1 Tax=Oedothorax gibbosus TaxID=931172 RepID=A0AAV6V6F8_9ARAC|nr:hypothetical protein JTE90_019593 [Oedothorax gibbosus]
MGIVRCMKVMSTGVGRLYIVCDVCEKFCDANVHGLKEVKKNERKLFKCNSCVTLAAMKEELDALKASMKDSSEQKGEGVCGLNTVNTDGEVYSLVDEVSDSRELDVSIIVEDSIHGVVWGDSMVGILGTNIQRKFSNMVRCCLPGAKVADITKTVEKTVKKTKQSCCMGWY